MGTCCSVGDDRHSPETPSKPSRKRFSARADAYRSKDVEKPVKQSQEVGLKDSGKNRSVDVDDEYPSEKKKALLSSNSPDQHRDKITSGSPTQNANSPLTSKPRSGSYGGSTKSLGNNDLTESHEEEIKKIMAALDRGGTKEEIAELESRLSKMSRAISMEDHKKTQRKGGGLAILSPIQENTGVVIRSGSMKAQVEQRTDHSSDVSSDESVEESSSSDSDDHLSSPAHSQKGFSSSTEKKYTQTLKNERAIDSLQNLTETLPKLKPYYVA